MSIWLASYAARTFRGFEEAVIAGVVAALMVVWGQVIPDWSWEDFAWAEAVRFGLCLVVALGTFAGACYLNLDIPGFAPVCGLQGGFNAAVVAFMAFLLNKYADQQARAVIKRVRSRE